MDFQSAQVSTVKLKNKHFFYKHICQMYISNIFRMDFELRGQPTQPFQHLKTEVRNFAFFCDLSTATTKYLRLWRPASAFKIHSKGFKSNGDQCYFGQIWKDGSDIHGFDKVTLAQLILKMTKQLWSHQNMYYVSTLQWSVDCGTKILY